MWTVPTTPIPGRQGRPPGAANRLALEARARARETGELPHEFLLRVMRGEIIEGQVWDTVRQCAVVVYESADLQTRIDAAKACAPYFAPKMSSVEVVGTLFSKVPDHELNCILESAAAAAGITVGLAGEGEAGAHQEGSRRRVRVTTAP